VNVGAAFTVNALPPVMFPWSGFVMIRLRAEAVAEPLMVTFAVSEVELLNVVEFTVMPVPLNVTAAPLTKPVPTIVRFWLVAPWPRLVGDTDVNVGAVFTVNALLPVMFPWSGFVMIRLRAEAVAEPLMVTFAVRDVELLNVVEFTVMPVPLKVTAAPLTKPVPTIARFWLVAP
jgi:hypothetical protein